MNIKKINEELTTLLEDGGFALSGKASQVTELINKLAQEYGDLTIPEFINKLIEKEKNGEELTESLDNSHLITAYDFQERLLTDLTKYKYDKVLYNDGKLITPPAYIDVYYHTLKCEKESGWGSKDLAEIETYTVETNGVRDPYRKVVRIYCKDYELWDCFSDLAKKYNFEYTHIENKRTPDKVFVQMDIDIDDKTAYKEDVQIIANFLQELITKNNTELQKAREEAQSHFEELAKARREARANKNAANTTVKQALSKSSIAKKIQALQNPTPEQLAKILAAIEE